MNPTKESDIEWWWKQQDFDLKIHQYEGNCRWCYKKALNKLVRIRNDDPSVFDFPKKMEQYADIMPGDPRKIFRDNRTTDDILKLNIKPYDPDNAVQQDMYWSESGGCSESCEVFS